jgi:hypothetical protein
MSRMARLSRDPLFTAEPDRMADGIYPRGVRPAVMRLLWLGLLAMLILLTVLTLVWSLGEA